MIQSIEGLRVGNPEPTARHRAGGGDFIGVTNQTLDAEIVGDLLPGTALIHPLASAPCGSDVATKSPLSDGGYYSNGRWQKDLGDTAKLLENIDRLRREQGILTGAVDSEALFRIPNHESVVLVKDVHPFSDTSPDRYVTAGAFLPNVSEDEIKSLGYQEITVDLNDLEAGDLAIPHASRRCGYHIRTINPNTGFPDGCNRDTDNGHVRKRVPGHYEMPGYSFNGNLSYELIMLSRVGDNLRKWVEEDPQLRIPLLTQTEPFSCSIEAFRDILQKGVVPEKIGIIGDGANSAQLALFAVTAFPKTDVFVVGKTEKKLDAIGSIEPSRIHPVVSDGRENGLHELREQLHGDLLDVWIPTMDIESASGVSRIMNPSGHVVIWSAAQTAEKERHRFLGVVDNPRHIHPSYGGLAMAEENALLLLDAIAKYHPSRLEALASYPYQLIPLYQAAEPMEQLINGGYKVEMGGRRTSGKIVIASDDNNNVLYQQ